MDLKKVSLLFSACTALVVHYLGGWDMLIYTLMTLMVLDYISGVIAAGHQHLLSAKVGFWGITKKFMILIMVALAVSMDYMLNSPGAIRALIIIWYGANEGLSIIENAAVIGLPVPPWLKDRLTELKE